MSKRMLALIMQVKRYLDANGPLYVSNVWEAAKKIGIGADDLTQVLSHVRSPSWIEDNGWTIPFVTKGVATPKVYSVEHTYGATDRLRDGNHLKTAETETHLRRNYAGLKLESQLATGIDRQKATILAATTKAAIDMLDAIKP